MLKLKRVEIHGFKSFFDRTEMKFNGNGIAAVVGPNGCGKSNLSDAINWVLGEQSAKNLRGGRMEDVIFAGTRERKPLGMASVSMTLLADEKSRASAEAATGGVKAGAERAAERTGEITISRRLYRSGESEYLINGKLARLRDIQDLFLGTGLGPESYAIIEQGRIGQILSHKPQDRRAVIEEAAGITKFKMRKRLAEAKLEGAKQNLARVFDILEEVSRQANSLKRQAAKTKRYGELKAEMAGYLRQVLAARFKLLEREIAKTVIELNLASGELESILAAIANDEVAQAQLTESLYSTEAKLTEARKQLADLQLETERVRNKLEFQTKQISHIDARLVSRSEESALLERQHSELEDELDQVSKELAQLEEEAASASATLAGKGAARQEAQALLSERESQLESLHRQALELLERASNLKNRALQSEAQLASLEREGARAAAEESQALSDLEQIGSARDAISGQLASRQGELISITAQRRDVEHALAEKRDAFEISRQSVDRLRTELSRVKARRDSLEEVISHRSYTTETVKRVLGAAAQNHDRSFTPVGVVADFVEVDPQFEKAAEEFLQEELDYVVVREWADAERGIDVVRGGGEGRATFVVEKFDEPVSARTSAPPPSSERGLVGRLADALRFSNGLSSAPLDLLPRVANCYVASDREVAQELAVKYPDFWFLAADGISYHGPSVSGGKKTGAGPLALKRELRETVQIEEVKKGELAGGEQDLAALERDIRSLSEQLESLRQFQQAQEKDVLALDHESRKLAEDLQRSNSRLSAARLDLDRNRREGKKIEESLSTVRAELEQAEQARHQQESALEEARQNLPELQATVARLTEEHANLRAALAGFEERRRSAWAAKQRIDARVRELASRSETLEREKNQLVTEREELLISNESLAKRNGSLAGAIDAAQSHVTQFAKDEAGLRARIAGGEEQLKKQRQNAQVIQQKRSDLQVATVRLESDAKHVEETSQNELRIGAAELAAALELIPSETELAELDTKFHDVRQKLESLGPVNTQALEEFEEARERQEFLQTQRQDLLDSMRDTEKAIAELDAESRRRFTDAFQAVNAHFTELFQVLFRGGSAEMRLTDEGNVSESGIDVVASPPGKRLQSVLLLSGGERALTAMALLMAVFQYTPSPFCVLDEVDAPLDEPNIERLTRLLQSMSEQTQFIVITHAKRTMEAAQALYGVTMQEPGVSRLVSVKLRGEEPTEQRRETREPELAMV